MTPATIRFSAVVLAAGLSRRMVGTEKLLLDVGGKPMIRATVDNLLAAGPVETVVVTGHAAPEVEAALAGLPVRRVRNPAYAEGQRTSVIAGFGALVAPADAVMVVLGDQPLVRAADFAALAAAFAALDGPSILVPHYRGRRGNPVVFGARHIPAIAAGEVAVGSGRLIETHGDDVARVEFASDVYVVDCDTAEDYRALAARIAGR